MINSANKIEISNLFSPDTASKYAAPKYQREYTWSKDNWDDLIDDIEDSSGGHFVGSIICIYKETAGSGQITEFEVIDGQQRLTTISLLYAVIYKYLTDKEHEDNNLLLEIGNLRNRIINKVNEDQTKIQLSSQNNNNDDYRSILQEIGIINNHEDKSNRGNRQIYRAYRHYLNRLEDYSSGQLVDLLRKINNVILVRIEVNSTSDAFKLFESLNDRGVPLSAIDLIKNKILAEVDRKASVEEKEKAVDEAFKNWKTIINNLEEYSIQERFLRHYYNAYKWSDKIKVEGKTRATRSVLIDIYETLIDRDLEYIFNDLIEKSKIYQRLVKVSDTESLAEELTDLENVRGAPGYTLLLYLFSKENLENGFLRDVVNDLVKYFIRRNITDFPNTRNLDQIFIDLVAKLEGNGDINIEMIREYLFSPERFSSDDEFREKLNGDLYELNVDATRFILAKIESKHTGTKENRQDFWERDKSGKLIWTIEHIFPEGRNIPDSWVKEIADGDAEKARTLQSEWVHKLGNLTLTGYNQNLSNFDLEKKKKRKDSSGRYIGYKNGLYLNRKLKTSDHWTVEDIKKRTRELIDETLEIFKV